MENPENAQEPNELEAWKVMMDSMIKFIHASTKLMNTFNQKASNVILPQFCGMECMPCTPQKPKTSICAAAAYQQKAEESGNLNESAVDTPNPVNDTVNDTKDVNTINESTGDNTQEQVAPADNAVDGTQRTEDTVNNETPKINATVNETQKTNDTPNETPNTNNIFDETPKTNDNPNETPKRNDISDETPRTNDVFNETPRTKETSVGTQNPNAISNETQMTNGTPDKTINKNEPIAETRKTDGTVDDTQKTNETGDDSGLQSQKICKGKCSCSEKKKSKQELCACPVTSRETANLTESMAAKLTKAQSEIDGLKNELEKLQFMEYTKKSNTAALYKQIMKDTNMPKNMTSARSTSAPAQFTSMASVPSSCSPCCGRILPMVSPEPECRSSSTSPMAQPQFARGIPQGRGSPEPEFRSLYNTTAQSNFSGQQSIAASPMAPSQFSRSSPVGRGTPEPEFRSLYSKTMAQSRSPGETSIPVSRQGYTPTNKSATQNESDFLRKPAGWQVNTPTNTTTMQSYDDSFYPSPPGLRQGQTPTTLPTMQSYNESNFIRSPAPTAKNVARQDNTFGLSSPSFNDPAMTGVGLSRGNQSLLYRFPRASHSINDPLILPAFGASGPSFDNLLTSSMIGFPQGNQPQLQVPRGYPQMRPTEVECTRYKKPKRKPTSPIPNQSHYDPRYYPQMNGGGGVNRTVENQVPFRSIQVMQAAVTVCTPPRTYADSGMYDDPAIYDDQEYPDPTCDNFSCDNDTCENS